MRKVNWLLIVLLCQPIALIAEESETPDLEFLEFLGEWQSDGEEWLDAQELDELSVEAEVEDE